MKDDALLPENLFLNEYQCVHRENIDISNSNTKTYNTQRGIKTKILMVLVATNGELISYFSHSFSFL